MRIEYYTRVSTAKDGQGLLGIHKYILIPKEMRGRVSLYGNDIKEQVIEVLCRRLGKQRTRRKRENS